MWYNLTDVQKALGVWIIEKVRNGDLDETFAVNFITVRPTVTGINGHEFQVPKQVDRGSFSALVAEDLLILKSEPATHDHLTGRTVLLGAEQNLFTIRGKLYRAVDCDFEEADRGLLPISTLAQPHPPEIAMSLDRLRMRYPDQKKVGFLVMRFAESKPLTKLVNIIKATAKANGLDVIRADETEFHDNLWNNVRTYLHGCGFGIAIYERIEANEPNANVGLEVGYLMAMNKPVFFLKDKTLPYLQADLAGKLYKEFDPHDPETTVPAQMNKWLSDNGIVVSKKV